MEEYDPHITVDPISSLKRPEYTIRNITFENLNKSVETPFKIFSGKSVNSDVFDNFTGNIKEKFVENGRYVKGYPSWNNLKRLLTEASGNERNNKLTNFFHIDQKLWDSLSFTTLSLVFPKNPYEQIKISNKSGTRIVEPFDENCFTFLLNYIYSKSKACVLVPDIKLEGNNISIKKYLEHVDECVRILSQWNNKPIFVPLQIDLSVDSVDEILTHYAQKRYSNIWINFLAHQCDESYIANIRAIRQIINKKIKFYDVVLYYSHIQKEITPNIQADKVLASDILTQFNGADFVGINKSRYDDMPIFGNEMQESDRKHAADLEITYDQYLEMRSLHKNRLFDPLSYYYYNLNLYPHELPLDYNLLRNNESINRIANGVLLYSEIERTKQFALEHTPKNVEKAIKKEQKDKQKRKDIQKNPLKEYVEKLQGLKDYPRIKEEITNPMRQSTFLDDLGSLGKLKG
jgi:hypothetical protein